jgi:hypothetical protein
MRRAMMMVAGMMLVAVAGCGENSPSAPVDNIEKNVKSGQQMQTDLKDISKKNKDAARANPLNKKP